MNITTKFEIGQKAFTIDVNTLKVKEFEVGTIDVYVNGKGEVRVTLYPKDGSSFDGTDESKCFADRQSLIDHITEK